MRVIWLALGLLAFAIGIIGVALPLVPTVFPMILAAFFFARSSPRLHGWLLSHRFFGPPIKQWQESGAIAHKGKIWATVSIGVAFLLAVLLGAPVWVLGLQILILSAVLIFIWTRPDK